LAVLREKNKARKVAKVQSRKEKKDVINSDSKELVTEDGRMKSRRKKVEGVSITKYMKLISYILLFFYSFF